MSRRILATIFGCLFLTGALTACGGSSDSSSSSSSTTPKTLPNETAAFKTFKKKANKLCGQEQKQVAKLGAVELTNYTNGSTDITAFENLSKSALKEINEKAAKIQKKQNAIEDKLFAAIQAADVPSGQEENIKVWVAAKKAAQTPPDTPALSVGKNSSSKQAQAAALERRNAMNKADIYARLIGISNCSSLAVQLKKFGSLNGQTSPTAVQYTTLKGLDSSQLSKSGDTAKLKLDTPKRGNGEIAKISTPNKFKLATGETYEFGNFSPGKSGSCYDKYVVKKLTSKLNGKEVSFEVPKQSGTPKQAYVMDGTDSVNLQSMLKGEAVPPKDASKDDPFTEPMQLAARVAMTYRRGVWKACTADAIELSGLS